MRLACGSLAAACTHQLDLRLRLPPEGRPVANDLEREALPVLSSDLEHLPKRAAPQVAEHFEGVAAERGVGWHGDPIGVEEHTEKTHDPVNAKGESVQAALNSRLRRTTRLTFFDDESGNEDMLLEPSSSLG